MQQFKIPHTWVLVQVAGAFIEKVRNLYFEKAFHPEAAANVFGVVKSVPERLLYFKKEIDAIKNEFGGSQNCPMDRIEEIQWLTRKSSEVDTDMELKIDDTIIFMYNAYFSAYKDGRVFYQDKDILILIPYDMVILAIRGEEIIPVNGNVLLEPVITKHEGKIIVEDEEEAQIGVISHLGTPVRNYLGYEDTDDDFYQKGDHVCFKKHFGIPLEYSTFQTLDKRYFRLQRRNLLCKVTL